MNGDLMYDPMVTFEVNRDAMTITAVEFEQSMPPLYQRIGEDGIGHSIDGNGREMTLPHLLREINEFVGQWLDNIEQQGHLPVKAHLIQNGEETEIRFDDKGNEILPESEKQYDINYGHLGNGLSVWNRAEERDGDYVSLAHIDPDRQITWREKDLPDNIKAEIEHITRTCGMSVSVTQPEQKIFNTPPETLDNDRGLIANINGYIQSVGKVLDVTDDEIRAKLAEVRASDTHGLT
ncbi:MAG: hypothetical protein LBU32_07010 [Clostridiales bacterium]|nr:hypothetical protein [Clostridiales bacterium]